MQLPIMSLEKRTYLSSFIFSLIGLAVGAEKFLPDASEVMDLLLKTQTETEELEADDPQISYMISAWARMCKIIGKDFVQYLGMSL